MKINNKGFSLIEMLAVIFILGVLAGIMIPAASRLISENKKDNYNNLKRSLITAARSYVSDYRYEIELSGSCNADGTGKRTVSKINNNSVDGKLYIKYLVTGKKLPNIIKNPMDGKELDTNSSYVYVEYDCKTKNYMYGKCFLGDDGCTDTNSNKLVWK